MWAQVTLDEAKPWLLSSLGWLLRAAEQTGGSQGSWSCHMLHSSAARAMRLVSTLSGGAHVCPVS